jgi:hypothetical protein
VDSHSGYSAVSKGFWPFGISTGPIDIVRASLVMERHPKLEYLTTGTPQAAEQLVSGIFPQDRWMSGSGVVVLKNPAAPKKLRVAFYIPPNAPARQVSLLLDGRTVAAGTYRAPGPYTLDSAEEVRGTGDSATVEIRVDRTFTAPPDRRELGVVLIGVGFAQQ